MAGLCLLDQELQSQASCLDANIYLGVFESPSPSDMYWDPRRMHHTIVDPPQPCGRRTTGECLSMPGQSSFISRRISPYEAV